jgi:hypothetical protein
MGGADSNRHMMSDIVMILVFITIDSTPQFSNPPYPECIYYALLGVSVRLGG